MDKQKLKFEIIETALSILFMILLYILTYLMRTDNVWINIELLKEFILNGEIKTILIPCLIIISLFITVKSIIRDNLKTNIIITVTTIIITMISYYKYKILELPFLPTDILLARKHRRNSKIWANFSKHSYNNDYNNISIIISFAIFT